MEALGEPKKNLMEAFDEDSSTMRVFLRVKPISDKSLSCIQFVSDTTICAKPPTSSNAYKSKIQGAMTDHQFTFTKVLGPETSQEKVFDETMKVVLEEFIEGKNCLVFAYGATGSGKTHTIQGNLSDPGIMMRSLEVLFSSLGGKLSNRGHIKPYLGHATLLNEKGEDEEREYKESVLKGFPAMDFDGTYLSDASIASRPMLHSTKMSGESGIVNSSQASGKLESSIEEFASVLSTKLPEEEVFSVWVSFAEVYNEAVYDLLDPKIHYHQKPAQLKVICDSEGSRDVYIKDLSEIQVCSAEEAYKVLLVGRGNLKVAATKFNHVSSRSHSIFTVKLVKVPNVEDPQYAYVNRLSFCDLAGSERSGKLNSSSMRLKEAGNINTSLLVLGRCIETLKHNQRFPGDKRPVPVRDSKLTRIFQGFFLGVGRAYMVTNIAQSPDQFDETLHVLKFSALAQQVISQDLRPERLSSAFLQPVDNSDIVSEEEEEDWESDDDDDSVMNTSVAHMFRDHLQPHHLLRAIIALETKLDETMKNFDTVKRNFQKELLKREMEVRAELVDHYDQKRLEMEEEHRLQLEEVVKECEGDEERTVLFYKKFIFPKEEKCQKQEQHETDRTIIIEKGADEPTFKDAGCQMTPEIQVPLLQINSSQNSGAHIPVPQIADIQKTRGVSTQITINTRDFGIQAMPETKDASTQEMLPLKKMRMNSCSSLDDEESENIPIAQLGNRRTRRTVKKQTYFEELSPPERKARSGRAKTTNTKEVMEDEKPKLRKLRVRKPQI